MNPIENYSVYTKRMNQTIQDKLFFLEHLKPEIRTVVDFGCADGALGVALKETGLVYIGYDIDKTMLDRAEINGISPTNLFYDFDLLLSRIDPATSILVLSSVIHEVYSYGNPYEVHQFWNRVFKSGFAQVSIRDMGLANNKIAYGDIDPSLAVLITNKIYDEHDDYVPINHFKDYYQLLLKYWYHENWARESKEDYFPITVSEILDKVDTTTDYKVKFKDYFAIEFVCSKVRDELGIYLNHTTHYKLVLDL